MEGISYGPCGFQVEDSQSRKALFSYLPYIGLGPGKDGELVSIIRPNISQEALENFADFYGEQLLGRFLKTGSWGNIAEA
jgi:hypothetical protein